MILTPRTQFIPKVFNIYHCAMWYTSLVLENGRYYNYPSYYRQDVRTAS